LAVSWWNGARWAAGCYQTSSWQSKRRRLPNDGEHLLPGFRYSIADLFKQWDWE
jgi:hypothetical protein